jgi:hypothetical protein
MDYSDESPSTYGIFLFNIVYLIATFGLIAILASIAVVATCMVIVAIGQGLEKIQNKARNFKSHSKYSNPTEIIYYNTSTSRPNYLKY